ncbi:hypothetical protein EIP86_007990 [Pleurotus ostreatoroseus]|nr:hypothetical protein EIP86_007990 [Pleurotus ostreatoroseus]
MADLPSEQEYVAVSYSGYDALKHHLIHVEGYDIDPIAEVRRRIMRNRAELARRSAWLDLIVGEPARPYTFNVNSGIADMVTLRKGRKSIDLIRNASESPTFLVSRFWSTLQMNWFSATGFSCAYPSLTFKYAGLLSPGAVGDPTAHTPSVDPLIEKYERRGFKIHRTWEGYNVDGCGDNHLHELCPAIDRSFDDRYTLAGTFGTGTTPGRIGVRNKPTIGEWRVGWQLGGTHGGRNAEPCVRTWHSLTGQREKRIKFNNLNTPV